MKITTLDNNVELLIGFYDSSIFEELNGEHTLEFDVVKNPTNYYVYDMVQNESIVEVDGVKFNVEMVEESPYSKRVYATNLFFGTINDYVEQTFPDGLYLITEALDLAFSTSDWTYRIDDSYPQRAKLEEYGNDNALSMFKKVLKAFNSEYTIDTQNKVVTIKRIIGSQTDYQIRYKSNLTSINKTIDTGNVKTAIKVFYNIDEFGNYRNSIIYRSPNESKYARTRWAAPVMSEEITTQEQAVSTARLVLNDEPTINIELEFIALQQLGYDSDEIKIGNIVYLIDERMDINATARITAIKSFPYEPNKTPIVTISSIKKNISSLFISQQNNQAIIEQSAVKLKSIYNGCSISKEEGFKAIADNGVETIMNATEGISIKRYGDLKFFVDANDDELTMDGRFKVTSNSSILMEAFKDGAGGTIKIYDDEGNLNIKIGSNKINTQRTGGELTLYNDGERAQDARVEASIYRDLDAGLLTLYHGSDARVGAQLTAKSFGSEEAGLYLGTDSNSKYSEYSASNAIISDSGRSTTLTAREVTINGIPVKQNILELWDEIQDIWNRI